MHFSRLPLLATLLLSTPVLSQIKFVEEKLSLCVRECVGDEDCNIYDQQCVCDNKVDITNCMKSECRSDADTRKLNYLT